MSGEAAAFDRAPAFLAGGGQTGALMRSIDWSAPVVQELCAT